jgi:hypothetical protein
MASFRGGVLAPGCICFLYLMHFKISEIAHKNLAHPSSRAMLHTMSFHEKSTCCVAYSKKIIFGGKIYDRAKIVEMYTLFFQNTIKNMSFSEGSLCNRIEFLIGFPINFGLDILKIEFGVIFSFIVN